MNQSNLRELTGTYKCNVTQIKEADLNLNANILLVQVILINTQQTTKLSSTEDRGQTDRVRVGIRVRVCSWVRVNLDL